MAQKVFGITFGKKDDFEITTKSSEKKGFSIPFLNRKKKNEEVINESLAIDFVPSLPAVNVVPINIISGYTEKDTTKKFIRAGIGIAIVIITIVGYTNIGEFAHQSNLTQLEGEGDKLRSEITTITPFKNYKESVSAETKTISDVMVKDVDIQKIVDFVFTTASANAIVITNLDIKLLVDGTGDCVVTNPFQTSSVIGCVTVSGTQANATALNNFFGTIAKTSGYTDDFINNAQYNEDPTSNSFSGSFSFNSELYSNKYNNMLLPIDTLIQNGITFTAPTSTSSSSSSSSNSTTNGTTNNGTSGSSTSTPSPTSTTKSSTSTPAPSVSPSSEADNPNYTPTATPAAGGR